MDKVQTQTDLYELEALWERALPACMADLDVLAQLPDDPDKMSMFCSSAKLVIDAFVLRMNLSDNLAKHLINEAADGGDK
jgi:hypothetical protein